MVAHETLLRHGAADDEQQVVGIDRLGEEIEGAVAHCRHGVLHAAIGRHDDDGNVGVGGLHGAQHAEAIPVRQSQISDDDGRLMAREQGLGFGLIAGLERAVALRLEGEAEHRA